MTTNVMPDLRPQRDQPVARPFELAGQTGDEPLVVLWRVAHDAPRVRLHLVVVGQRRVAPRERRQRLAQLVLRRVLGDVHRHVEVHAPLVARAGSAPSSASGRSSVPSTCEFTRSRV